MLKKLLAILAALSMVLSLAACGSYEITIEKKDEEKVASDSVDKNEEEFEENEEEEEETEEETEEDTEEETEEEAEEDNSDKLSTKAEVKKFLSKYIDLDEYPNETDDTYLSYSMDYDYDEKVSFDYTLKVNGKKISFPAKYDDVKALGLKFASTMYNEKSEQNGNTTAMGWDFKVPGGGLVEIESVNFDDYAKPITDLDFYGARVYGYGFDHKEKEFVKKDSYTKFKINDTITAESTVEDVVEEFGVPANIYVGFSEYYTSIVLTYEEQFDVYNQKIDIRFNYYKGKAMIEEVHYTYPEEEI